MKKTSHHPTTTRRPTPLATAELAQTRGGTEEIFGAYNFLIAPPPAKPSAS